MTGTCPRSAIPASFLVLAAALAGPALPAQAPKLDREIEFVRALAREMRFIGLAQSEIERLAQAHRAAADQDRIAQLGVEVSLLGAKVNADRSTQRQRYKEGLDKSRELLERTSDEAVMREARATLADAVQEFGQFLIEELEMARNENPDAVKGLEEEAGAVFKSGVEACDRAMKDLEATVARLPAADKARSTELKLQHGLMWLRKGVLLREHGRAVRADRGFLVERARTVLEELALEVGEETALGLRALFEIAQCDEVLGKHQDAIDSYRGAVRQIETSLRTAADLGLNADTQAFLFQMMQEVYDHLAGLLFQVGRTADAQKLFDQFRAHLGEFGEKGQPALAVADPRFGHSVFLTEARFKAESGDANKVHEALAMAQQINELHPADFVGVRAKAVMRDILAAQQKLVSGRLLFEVAKGEHQNKNHEAAIIGLRRALVAMNDEERGKLGLEAFDMMGRSFAATERWLEAVLAFREGLRRHGGQQKDAAEGVADYLDRAMMRLRTITKNDPAFEPLAQEVTRLITDFSGARTANKLQWKQATQAMSENRFREAAAHFAAITNEEQYVYYELARVRVADALQKAGDLAGAKKALADYQAWLGTKDAALDSRRPDKQQVRQQAAAEAAYRDAIIAYVEAQGSGQPGAQKDLTKYPAAIEKLRAFLSNHQKDADQLTPHALDNLGRLHTELGEMPKAEEAYIALRERNPALGSKLCAVIFEAYLTQVENLEQERDKALNAGGDQAPVDRIRNELKATRQRLVALGLEYLRTSPEPQYAMFYNTVRQFDELKDWVKVEEVARKAIERFGADATHKESVDRVLRPKIGEALLGQKKFQQAYDMLVEAEKVNPDLHELKRLIALALGGWFELDQGGRPVTVPGLDRPAEAYEKYWGEYREWGLRPQVEKYSLEWYRFHWEAYWFARRAGEKETKYRDLARTLFNIARSVDGFEALKRLGEAGRSLFNFFNLNRQT